MKLEMTERDKKLIVMLAIFVVVVCIGYWGIRPQVKAIINFNKENKVLREQQAQMELLIAETPMLEKDNEDMEAEIVEARKDYYDEMSSDQIEKYFTNMALDYNLYAYDLDMQISEDYTELAAYQYSKKAKEDILAEEAAQAEAAAEEEHESTGGASAEAAADAAESLAIGSPEDVEGLYEGTENVIHIATVTQKLGGKQANFDKFLDDISNIDKRLRVVGYSYSDDRVMQMNADGEYSVGNDKSLTITVEIYMCVEHAPEDGMEDTAEE